MVYQNISATNSNVSQMYLYLQFDIYLSKRIKQKGNSKYKINKHKRKSVD